MDDSLESHEAETPSVEVDEIALRSFMQKAESEQNLLGGTLAGAGAALLGAAIWAAITATTHFQIGWMAVGVGFLVGFAVRSVGKGMSSSFGIVGAVMALAGCVLGNYLAVCVSIAQHFEISFLDVATGMSFSQIAEVVKETFHILDVLFYGIAVYEGYKLSFRQISEEEIRQFVRPTAGMGGDSRS